MEEKLIELEKYLYRICVALVTVVNEEGSTLGFADEVIAAENFIKHYEGETEHEN